MVSLHSLSLSYSFALSISLSLSAFLSFTLSLSLSLSLILFLFFSKGNYGHFAYDFGLSAAYGRDGMLLNRSAALLWFQRGVDSGHTLSMIKLGKCYELGLGGLVRDLNRSYQLYLRAAEAGDPQAMYLVGLCYNWGSGTSRNDGVALQWLRRAIDAGDADSCEILARAYKNQELGLTQDGKEAVRMLYLAIERGSAMAMYTLGFFMVGCCGRGWEAVIGSHGVVILTKQILTCV